MAPTTVPSTATSSPVNAADDEAGPAAVDDPGQDVAAKVVRAEREVGPGGDVDEQPPVVVEVLELIGEVLEQVARRTGSRVAGRSQAERADAMSNDDDEEDRRDHGKPVTAQPGPEEVPLRDRLDGDALGLVSSRSAVPRRWDAAPDVAQSYRTLGSSTPYRMSATMFMTTMPIPMAITTAMTIGIVDGVDGTDVETANAGPAEDRSR